MLLAVEQRGAVKLLLLELDVRSCNRVHFGLLQRSAKNPNKAQSAITTATTMIVLGSIPLLDEDH